MKRRRNNNKQIVNHLAMSSIKESKLRNFFIIFAIVLSVSLLMVMALFVTGLEKNAQREVARVQHVIYHEVTEEQIANLKREEDVELLVLSKSGTGIEVDEKMIQPMYYGQEALKGEISDIDMLEIKEGTAPRDINEIAVSEGYCASIGIEAEVGTEISLMFLDGTTEVFVISGILDMEENNQVYPILFSEEYAENGPQLANTYYDAIVRIAGAEHMSQSKSLELIRGIGDRCGIERKNVNENGNFLDTLAGEQLQQQRLLMFGIGVGILFVSILVIYSVFYLSVIGRIRQFGQLRTIGMTKKQVKKMITKEGLILSAIGIPCGLLIGGVIGYIIKPGGWDWITTILMGIMVAIADIITVLISIHKPAKIASSISPIEAAKFSGYTDKKVLTETRKLNRKITPASLAMMSTVRNRKKTALTILSLGVGGVLFMMATTFISSMNLEEYSKQLEFKYGEFYITHSYNVVETAEHGLTSLQMNNPLNEELKTEIMNINGVKEITTFARATGRWEAHGETSEDTMSGFKKGSISESLIEEGTVDYDEMVRSNKIVICSNNTVKEVFGWEYEIGDIIKFTYFNGERTVEKEFTVAAIISAEYGKMDFNAGWFLFPEDTINEMMYGLDLTTDLIVSTEDDKIEAVEEELQTILSEQPLLTMTTLSDQMEKNSTSFNLFFSIVLGLSLFIISFSILNLINTLITNIVTRKQEFAMLKSIGMSNKQLNRMIQMEGILLTAGNIGITLLIGTMASIGVIELLRQFGGNYMHFAFPIWFFLGYIILIIAVPIIVSVVAIHMFNKQSLVERLKETA